MLEDEDVPGRINDPRFFSFWRDVLEAPKDILEIIQNGYSVPFIDGILLPPAFAANNQSGGSLKERFQDKGYRERFNELARSDDNFTSACC